MEQAVVAFTMFFTSRYISFIISLGLFYSFSNFMIFLLRYCEIVLIVTQICKAGGGEKAFCYWQFIFDVFQSHSQCGVCHFLNSYMLSWHSYCTNLHTPGSFFSGPLELFQMISNICEVRLFVHNLYQSMQSLITQDHSHILTLISSACRDLFEIAGFFCPFPL